MIIVLGVVAATILAQASYVEHDFEGMRLKVVSPPKDPFSRDASQVWEGRFETEIEGRKQNVCMFSVVVTDLAKLTQRPTDDEVLQAHERRARVNQLLRWQNLRTTRAKLGQKDLLVLNGTAIAPDAAKKPHISYWISFAFIYHGQAFEFNQISTFESYYLAALRNLSNLEVGPFGASPKLTGVPLGTGGDYQIADVPWVVTTNMTPLVDVGAPRDPLFADQYDATITPETGLGFVYKLRKLRADDTRSDLEIFRGLAADYAPVSQVPDSQFSIANGSGAAEFGLRKSARDWRVRLRFEHVGQWVAIVAGTKPATSEASLAVTDLRRNHP